jgi:hypothetical protein
MFLAVRNDEALIVPPGSRTSSRGALQQPTNEDSHSRTIELQTPGTWINAVTPDRCEGDSLRFGVQPQVPLEHGGTSPKENPLSTCLTRSDDLGTYHPTTVVQYASGTAKIRSSLRLLLEPGREKTVSAFAITSVCDDFGVF